MEFSDPMFHHSLDTLIPQSPTYLTNLTDRSFTGTASSYQQWPQHEQKEHLSIIKQRRLI